MSPGKLSAGGCAGFALNPGSTPAEGIQGSAVGSSWFRVADAQDGAMGFLGEARRAREMSVTGFEDTALSRHIDPTLC